AAELVDSVTPEQQLGEPEGDVVALVQSVLSPRGQSASTHWNADINNDLPQPTEPRSHGCTNPRHTKKQFGGAPKELILRDIDSVIIEPHKQRDRDADRRRSWSCSRSRPRSTVSESSVSV